MRVILGLMIVALSSTPVLLKSQAPQPRDTSIAVDSSSRDPSRNFIEVGQSRFRVCARLSRTKCAFIGAGILGTIGYLIGDVLTPNAEYAVRGSTGDLGFGVEECISNCNKSHKAIAFSITGAAFGGIMGWLGGRR